MSPRIRARMAELQLTTADLAGIMGTGAGNRVTIKDLENFLFKIESQTAQDASAIRTGVADAMRRSWTRPLSTIGSSVNLDPVLQDRQSRDPKPGPGLYALRALALALAETPGAAAKLIGNRVVQSTSIDVGIAVEAEDGIMVPVIRSAAHLARHASWRHRNRFKLRNFWNGMGHANSAAGPDIAAWSRGRKKSSVMERTEKGIRSENRGTDHAEL